MNFRQLRKCYLQCTVHTLIEIDGGVVMASLDWARGSSGGRCSYAQHFRKMTADCLDKGLEEIPARLDRSIKILYASHNRIRSIYNTSLQSYSNLELLYLRDNFILEIEEGAFSELTELEVLDLSKNALITLPAVLPLPLRKLYLHENRLQNLTLSAAFNLEYLSLAECKLTEIPKIGVLPNLKTLNLTLNPLADVTPRDLAPLCRLKTLLLPSSLYHQGGEQVQCRCHRLLTWTSHHNIATPQFNCTPLVDPDASGCEMNLTAETSMYNTCLVAEPPPTTARLLLLVALAVALLIAVIVLLCWWRKGRRKTNSVQDQRARTEKSAKVNETLIT